MRGPGTRLPEPSRMPLTQATDPVALSTRPKPESDSARKQSPARQTLKSLAAPELFSTRTSVRYDSCPTTYVSRSTSRTPVVPAATVVRIVNGFAAVPVPVIVCSTGVQAVRGLAAPPAGMFAGPYSVPSKARKVPQAVSPNHSPCTSWTWLTAQLRSRVIRMRVSGPAETIATSTGVVSVEELLAVAWSAKPAAATVAVFVTSGPVVTRTTSSTVSRSSGASVPRLQVTAPPASVQVGLPGVTLTNSVP